MADLKQALNWKEPKELKKKKVWLDAQIHEKQSRIKRLELDVEDIKKLQIAKIEVEIDDLKEELDELEEQKSSLDKENNTQE